MIVTFDFDNEEQAKEVEKHLSWNAFVVVHGKRLSVDMNGIAAPDALSRIAEALFSLRIGV